MRPYSSVLWARLFTAVLLMFAFPAVLPAQGVGRIEGLVTDASTGSPLEGAQVIVQSTGSTALTGANGRYWLENVPAGLYVVLARRIGYTSAEVIGVRVTAGKTKKLDFELAAAGAVGVEEIRVTAEEVPKGWVPPAAVPATVAPPFEQNPYRWQFGRPPTDREEYGHLVENPFLAVTANPLSTFAADVDRASYANVRRFLLSGRLPPPDAVRIEELTNYFRYDYAGPTDDRPIAVHAELAPAPWRPEHRLLRIGIQARTIETERLPASNLVFLLDVSGSMQPANKLPLVKRAFELLVEQLRPEDRVAIVVYAGAAGEVLPSTPGSEKAKILAAIDRLQAGGSTAGGAGIQLAYAVAEKNLLPGGNNRVVLATDGDFNVGVSGEGELIRLIEKKRESGVFLTIVSVGEGNLQDRKMEQLADHGNGNYAYIDNILEAQKVFVQELGGTLHTVAKDVKIQVEFNPAHVSAYRLIGYENRLLRDEDFANDKKDAGDMGSGHSVTALYEIIPAGAESDVQVWNPDSLRYQTRTVAAEAASSPELAFLKFRYKDPADSTSKLVEFPMLDRVAERPSRDFVFQTAVVEFGLLLRQSEYVGAGDLDRVLRNARASLGEDPNGYRAEFVKLVGAAKLLGLGKVAQR
jgi:Ca-activated chloride channel family protein